MDLIYTNKRWEDEGVLKDYAFDLAFGSDENNFEVSIVDDNHCCEEGSLLYIEGTEYGGVVDAIKVATKENEVTYKGRTWHGVLASKVIEPDSGQDYLLLNGEANALIGTLLQRLGLTDLFAASSVDSELTINNYTMNRYIDAYAGIRKMLTEAGGKLQFKFSRGKVVLSAVSAVDYSQDEQFDNDQVEMEIEKHYNKTNHLICLGKGDLAQREVVHLYADKDGNISTTQTLYGLDEITAVYDYANAESLEELTNSGIEKLTEYASKDMVNLNFDAEQNVYDIGDIVGATEYHTGIITREQITKKIVTINNGHVNIEYKVGESK